MSATDTPSQDQRDRKWGRLLLLTGVVITIGSYAVKHLPRPDTTATDVQIDIPDLEEMSQSCQSLCGEYKVAMLGIADIEEGNFLEHPYALTSITSVVAGNALIAMDELKTAEGEENLYQCLHACTIETDEMMFPVHSDI